MVSDLDHRSISHLLGDIAVKLTLGSIVVLSLGDGLLERLNHPPIFHAKKKAVRIVASELNPATTTSIPCDADRRIIDIVRMARNADIKYFAGHKEGGLLH